MLLWHLRNTNIGTGEKSLSGSYFSSFAARFPFSFGNGSVQLYINEIIMRPRCSAINPENN